MLKPNPVEHPICYAPPSRLALSAWLPHVPFGMYLVDLLRPDSIVELGTRNGVSYCAFCQAVQELGLPTNCVAVDTWRGDEHTGAYSPRVLAELRRFHDPLYGSFSHLLPAVFDEAALGFADGSIDLLHIDGFHTYEAARHDFETWLPKMSRRGVVLFHDIAEHGRDFGVWRLWAELSSRHPSFAFQHGHGLGVLGVGADVPEAVAGLLQASSAEAEEIRRFFRGRGRRLGSRVVIGAVVRLPGRLASAAAELTRKLDLGSAPGG